MQIPTLGTPADRRSRGFNYLEGRVGTWLSSSLPGDSFWLLLARLGTQLGMALFTILLARQLGAAAFGEYAFIAALLVVGNVVTTWGTDMLLIREIAADDDLSLVAPALVLQLAASALFVCAVLAALQFMTGLDAAAVAALRIYSLALFPMAFFTVFTSALRGRQRMREYAFLSLALVVLQLAAVLFLLQTRGGLVFLAVLLFIVQLIGALLAGLLCGLRLRIRGKPGAPGFTKFRQLVRLSSPIAVVAVLGIVYQRLSLLLLPALAGAQAAGQFSAAWRLVEAAKLGHVAVLTALYPLMARAAGGVPPSDWSRRFQVPWLFLIAAAFVAAFGLTLLAGPLVLVLFGSGYAQAGATLGVLSWTLIPYSISAFLTLAFLAAGDTGPIVRALGLGIIMLAILTAWWVPVAGERGAAWAVLAAELAQSVLLLLHEFRRIHGVASIARIQGLA